MRYVLLVTVSALLLGGCRAQPYRTAERMERGLVIVLTGVEGRGRINEAICRGLDAGGVDWAIELRDWTSALGPLYNLRAQAHNRRKAEAIGRRIARYRWDYPGRAVVVVGQSGGGAMAVWVAESLLPGQRVDGLILLAAALSPQYMLDFALDNCRRGIVNFRSSRDWMLGVGTTLYGTMDGEHTSSAGRVGFKVPTARDRAKAYEKVIEVSWRKEMAKAGHSGSHLTSGAARYVATYVAPFVLTERWDEKLRKRVEERRWRAAPTSIPATVPASAPATAPAVSPASAPASAPATRARPRGAPASAGAP